MGGPHSHESIAEKNARLMKARIAKQDIFQRYFEEKLKAAVNALPYGSKVKPSDLAKQIQLDAREIICRAADHGDFHTLEKLVRTDNSLVHSQVNRVNETPLHIACRKGDIAMVKFLIEYGQAPIYALDHYGNQPLHTAAFNGKASIVRYLIEVGGASIDDLGYKFQSAIIMAAQRHELYTVRVLLELGADPRYKDPITGKFGLPRLTTKIVSAFEEEEEQEQEEQLQQEGNSTFSGDIYIGDTIERVLDEDVATKRNSIDKYEYINYNDNKSRSEEEIEEEEEGEKDKLDPHSASLKNVFGDMEIDYGSGDDFLSDKDDDIDNDFKGKGKQKEKGQGKVSRPTPLNLTSNNNSKRNSLNSSSSTSKFSKFSVSSHSNDSVSLPSSPLNFNGSPISNNNKNTFTFHLSNPNSTNSTNSIDSSSVSHSNSNSPARHRHTPRSSPRSALIAANSSATGANGMPKNYAFLLHSPTALEKSIRSPRYAHLNEHAVSSTTSANIFNLSGRADGTEGDNNNCDDNYNYNYEYNDAGNRISKSKNTSLRRNSTETASRDLNEKLVKLAALPTATKLNYLSPKLLQHKSKLINNLLIHKYTNAGPLKPKYKKKIKKDNTVVYQGTETYTDIDPVESLYPNDQHVNGVNVNVLVTLLLQDAWERNTEKYGELPWRVVLECDPYSPSLTRKEKRLADAIDFAHEQDKQRGCMCALFDLLTFKKTASAMYEKQQQPVEQNIFV